MCPGLACVRGERADLGAVPGQETSEHCELGLDSEQGVPCQGELQPWLVGSHQREGPECPCEVGGR